MNGYKDRTDLRARPQRALEDRRGRHELATLGWVHWHNTTRLHGYLDDLPPAEFEARSTMPNGATNPGRNPIALGVSGGSRAIRLVVDSSVL